MICRERQVAIMPRPKKFPDYNADKIQKELIKAVKMLMQMNIIVVCLNICFAFCRGQ